jgi:hypothetical protein
MRLKMKPLFSVSPFSVPPANGQGPQKKAIPGQFIAKATTNYPRHCRAEDAAQWMRGKVEVAPTLKLAAATFGVQPAEVKAARERLEQSERKRFGNGGTAILSDSVIEHIVREIGADRIWRAVDKLTSPELSLVAAE